MILLDMGWMGGRVNDTVNGIVGECSELEYQYLASAMQKREAHA